MSERIPHTLWALLLGYCCFGPLVAIAEDTLTPSFSLNDLGRSVEDHLSIDVVESVRVDWSGEEPKLRVIHIHNWHYVSKATFDADQAALRQDSPDSPTTDFDDFLRQVDVVQSEQTKLLSHLIHQGGLKQVFYEGLVQEEVALFNATLQSLKSTRPKMARAKQLLPELREMLREANDKSTGDASEAQDLKFLCHQLSSTLDTYRADLLQVGAAGKLVLNGEQLAIKPLDSQRWLERTNPVDESGRVRQVPRRQLEAREDAMVRELLDANVKCAVIVLGGGHDLTDNLRRVCRDDWEHISVATRSHRRFTKR